MRLLIAEDEVDLAEALTAFFEKNQFAVDSVHNGFDAYEYGSSGEYDAIILDVMMPKMDGLEVCRRIRKLGNTPVMMLTAKGETFDKVLGLELGADDYMVKPFDTKEVVARIKAVLRRCQNSSAAAERAEISQPMAAARRALPPQMVSPSRRAQSP